MQPFAYARPASLAEAVALLVEHGPDARVLAGGTDLVIRLRDGTAAPRVVVDVKRVPELAPGIRTGDGGRLVIGATTTMTEIAAHPVVRRDVAALAEAAAVVGSVQIRNRATLAGNLCNASPAADTAPALLVHAAVVVVAGPGGTRRIPIDELFVRSGVTTLAPGELVTAVEIPARPARLASAHERRTRRRGHDLASVTVACGVDGSGATRVAYGSVGPRPLLRVDATGVLADPAASADARAAAFEAIFADAKPSAGSMRAAPDYRLAMLRVLGGRALATALERLADGGGDVIDTVAIRLTVNGAERAVAVAPHHTLLEVLRDDLALTGTKECCLVGECGACTVIVDGRPVDSCLVLAVEADGARVLTVEGLAARDGRLAPIQAAFLDSGAVQCGFCIPGQLLAAHALLADSPHPARAEIEEAMAGNLCRCGCYEQIFEAIEAVASGAATAVVATPAAQAAEAAAGARVGARSAEEGLDQ